ncbi:alkaline shock response membrane anchor protein AmaP [Streptococcus sanguinis]|uniref:Alkaline shock response membrane anchor protein AmaP n=1 Tax=Streptococcus sanguinis TaxID=1305 RepID=A0AAJ5T9B1_STRSA|nr:alkaline shock response membrane anchor protein AmaP [Streptococcus sanguinis]RSI56146.1 hypothetical protein D8870_02090 [Streptococcus sanguinis]VDY69794.1 Uncharacterised protein [Streptococcus sanguinis]
MSKSRKILSIIFCILILTILIPVLLDFHKVSGLGLQMFGWKLFTWKQIPFVGYFLSRYVFWGTVVLASLILLLILVILFYPKRPMEIQLADGDGKLMLKNSAIEGFVRSLVTDHDLIKDPTVSVNSRKNKCMVSVKGAIVPSENIIKRSQLIQEEIETGLKQFFGLNHTVKLKISVSDFKPKAPAKKTTSRVK